MRVFEIESKVFFEGGWAEKESERGFSSMRAFESWSPASGQRFAESA
jgi:hypothetical protein